ncbi:hypothetical protein [Falsiroseomonas sp.]
MPGTAPSQRGLLVAAAVTEIVLLRLRGHTPFRPVARSMSRPGR